MDTSAQTAAQCIKDCEQKIREATVTLKIAATELARKGDAEGLRRLAELLPEDRRYEHSPHVRVTYVSTRQIFERVATEIASGQIPAQYLERYDFNR